MALENASPQSGADHASEQEAPTKPASPCADCERLRQENQRLEKERDEYRHMMHQILGQYFDAVHGKLTEDKLLHMIANEKWLPLEDFIDELEQICKEK
jgi:hypothetical protein